MCIQTETLTYTYVHTHTHGHTCSHVRAHMHAHTDIPCYFASASICFSQLWYECLTLSNKESAEILTQKLMWY